MPHDLARRAANMNDFLAPIMRRVFTRFVCALGPGDDWMLRDGKCYIVNKDKPPRVVGCDGTVRELSGPIPEPTEPGA